MLTARAHSGPRPGTWLAALAAAFSALLVGVMTGAAILCADGACQGLATPTPNRAVLDLEQRSAELPVTPGRLPTAEPAR